MPKTNWYNRPRVQNCPYLDPYCDCPYCEAPYGVHCMHPNSPSEDCFKKDCPLYTNGRWKKEEQE